MVEGDFWARVSAPDSRGCREWLGVRSPNGYGRVTARLYAHRAAYAFAHGSIPQGHLICHHCDNKLCVEPSHLYAGTKSQNAADAVARGQHYSPFLKRERIRHGLAPGGPATRSGGLRW